MTSASKVGDLFSAAGEAFAKLAELTNILQTSVKNGNSSKEDNSENVWSANDTELLQIAVKRFGDELNVISEHIKDKTMHQIKSTFRKIQPSISNALNDKSNINMNSASIAGHDSVAYQSSNRATSTEANATATHASSSSAIASTSFPQTSTSGGAGAATSSCSSPSPFLHYPLLRKSADITLNMLNARDDSDDDERMSMSVFNSV